VNYLSSRGELREPLTTPPASAQEPSAPPERLPVWAIAALPAALLGLAYVIAAPASSDLAAAAYRSDLFSRAGFTLWDNSWYGGHHLPAYSVLAPALGAWIGPQLLNALSMVAATALFAQLIDGRFPAPATRIAAIWFALGASVELLPNRVPFDLGLALGLGALLAARAPHGRYARHGPALVLAVLCALTSPVAGAFLALALLAWALAGPARAWPLGLAVAVLAPIALLVLAFPEGGSQPFVASAFYPALLAVVAIGSLIVRDRHESKDGDRFEAGPRVLAIGSLLYAAALIGAFLIPTAVGGNADRLGALFAGPIAACVLYPRHRLLLLALAPFLFYWQVKAPITDFASAASDPAVHASYYTPLLDELRVLGVGYGSPHTRPARIEVVPTRNHWEARWMAPHVMLARGWERQLDQDRNALFYNEARTPLTSTRYRTWLSAEAVSYIALPDAPLDYSGEGEARLLRSVDRGAGDASSDIGPGTDGGGDGDKGAPSYLREIWRSAHWRLFAVLGARPLAEAPAILSNLTSDSFTLSMSSPGYTAVRIRFTPYWAVLGGHGCVSQAPGGWTEVQARTPGSVRVGIDFSPARVFDHGPRCS
jgi:MFS family permease